MFRPLVEEWASSLDIFAQRINPRHLAINPFRYCPLFGEGWEKNTRILKINWV